MHNTLYRGKTLFVMTIKSIQLYIIDSIKNNNIHVLVYKNDKYMCALYLS